MLKKSAEISAVIDLKLKVILMNLLILDNIKRKLENQNKPPKGSQSRVTENHASFLSVRIVV
jgi:hypothetical protein